MILTSTLRTIAFFSLCCCLLSVKAQTEVPNGGFENWDNVGNNDEEPQSWSANKTGGGLAGLAPQTCFRESNNPYAGDYCVKVETDSYFGAVVNGAATTGRIEAPNTNPANGYLRTIRSDADFNSPFSGRPDSLVGYFRYQSENGDQAKVEVFLHGDYDVENPDQGGSAPFMIATATFLTPSANVDSWTRFSVPFNYSSPDTPLYFLAVVSASVIAGGGEVGSTLWVDELETIYNPCGSSSNLTITACEKYLSPSSNYLWTSTGTYADTLPNIAGCDSIINIDLMIENLTAALVQNDFVLSTSLSDASYQWIDCSNDSVLSTEATYTVTANGSYALIATKGSCTDTSDCVVINTVSLENEAFRAAVKLYPNPAQQSVIIDWQEAHQQLELLALNTNGQIIWQESYQNLSQTQIDLTDWPAGIYALKIKAEGREAILKLVVRD
ncbi:MAG: PCMD domain-containing protein [Bacteroidota bacterium]